MKNYFLGLMMILLSSLANAQTSYYYISGALNVPGNWNSARNGSGTALTNFTGTNRTYVIQSGQVVTNSSAFSISGSGTKFQIENNASLTANAGITLAAATVFQVDNGGTYIHNTNTHSLFSGTESFAPGSTVQISNWINTSTTLISSITASVNPGDGNNYYFSNLIINWSIGAGNVWDQSLGSSAVYLAAGNFTVNNSFNGTFRLTSSNNDVNVYVYGNFSWNGSGAFDFTTRNKNSRLYVNGNFTQSAGTMTASGSNIFCIGIVQTYGTGSAEWSITGGNRTYVTFTVASSKTVNLASDFNMGSGLSVGMTIQSGAVLDAGTYKMSMGNTGQVTVSGTIRTANPNGLFRGVNATLSSSPAYLRFAAQSNCTVEYYATGSQVVTDTSNYENVIISGTGVKTLPGSATINKTLTLNSGGNKLDIQNNILTISSTGSIGTYSATDYIITGSGSGRLRQNAVSTGSSRIFPVGTSAYYLPVTLTPNTSSSDFSVNVFEGATQEGVSGGTPWSTNTYMVNANWNVDRNGGTGVVDVKINWDGNLEGSYFSTLPDVQIGMWRKVGGTTWSLAAATIAPNSNNNNFSTAVAAGNFTTQYMISWIQGILPLELIKLSAIRSYDHNFISWQMENSSSIDKFEVERSENNTSFLSLGFVRTSSVSNYSFQDYTALGNKTYYYRLKLVDANGNIQYSPVTMLKGTVFKAFSLASYIVTDQLRLKHPSNERASYRLISTDGKLLMASGIPRNSNNTSVDVSRLPSGIYMVQYVDSTQVSTERFLKQ